MNQLLGAAAVAASTGILATRTLDLPSVPTLLPTTTATADPSNPERPQSSEHPNRPYERRGMMSIALILSAVSGGLLILTLLSVAVWCGLRLRRKRRCHDRRSDAEIALKQSIGGRDRDSRHHHPTARSSSSSEKKGESFNGQSPYQNHASASSITMMLDGQESSTGSNRSTLLETSSSSIAGKVTYPPKAMTSPKLSSSTRGNRFPKTNAVGGTRSTSIPQPSNSQSLLPPPRQQQQQSAHDYTYYPHLHQPQPRQPGKQSPVEGVTPLESFYHDMINAPASPSSPPPPEQAQRLILSSKHAVPLPLPFSSSFSTSTSSSSSPSKAGPESTKSVATSSAHKKSASMSSTAASVTSPRSINAALDWPRVSKEHLPPPPPPPSMPPPAIPENISDPLTLQESTAANASTSGASTGPSSSSTVQFPTSPTQVPATPTPTSRKSVRSRSATESSVKSPRSSNSTANRSSNGDSVESMQQQQPQQESPKGSHLKLASPVPVPTSLGQGAILTVPARSGPGHRRTKSNILTLDSVATSIYTSAPSPSPRSSLSAPSPSPRSSLSAFPSPPATTPSASSFSVPSRAVAMNRSQDRKPPVSSVLQPTKSLGPMAVQVPRPTSWYLKAEDGGGLVAVAGGEAGGAGGGGEGRTVPLQKNIKEVVADSRRDVVASPSYSYM